MTREINSTFEHEGNTYKVVEDTTFDSCAKCAFGKTGCKNTEESLGKCFGIIRTDGKDVHFELVSKE